MTPELSEALVQRSWLELKEFIEPKILELVVNENFPTRQTLAVIRLIGQIFEKTICVVGELTIESIEEIARDMK